MKRETKIKIRRITERIRTGFLCLALITAAVGIAEIDGVKPVLTATHLGAGFIFFIISVLLDELLFQTAWSGDKKSPFWRGGK